MPTDINGKNTLSNNNHSIINNIHFAVCPYIVQTSQSMKNLFTLNFQKDNQIVGELSTMIYPKQKQGKQQIDMMKNIMFFRIYNKQKSYRYKWSLYDRDLKGRQKVVQSVDINLQQHVQQYINRLRSKKDQQNNVRKNSITQSRTLSISSKVNQYRQKDKLKFKQRQKQKQLAVNKRKKSLNKVQLQASRASKQQRKQEDMYMKQMKCRFVQCGVGLEFVLCMGVGEDEIRQSVQRFYLQSKLKIISNTFGGNNGEGKQLIDKDYMQQNKVIIEDRGEENTSNKQIQRHRNDQKVVVEESKQLDKHKRQVKKDLQRQMLRNQLNLQQINIISKQQQIQMTGQQKQYKDEKQWSLKGKCQQQQKCHQQMIQYYKQTNHQTKQTNPQTKQNQNKPQHNQQFKQQQQSQLDDVILYGKRYSVEEKSDWMRTSKSDENSQKNKSLHMQLQLQLQQQNNNNNYNLSINEPKLIIKGSNNLQLVSRNDDQHYYCQEIQDKMIEHNFNSNNYNVGDKGKNNNLNKDQKQYQQRQTLENGLMNNKIRMKRNLSQTMGNYVVVGQVGSFDQGDMKMKGKQIKVRRKYTPQQLHSSSSLALSKGKNNITTMCQRINNRQQVNINKNNQLQKETQFDYDNNFYQNVNNIQLNNNNSQQQYQVITPVFHQQQYQVITPAFHQIQITTITNNNNNNCNNDKNNMQTNNLFANLEYVWMMKQQQNNNKNNINKAIDNINMESCNHNHKENKKQSINKINKTVVDSKRAAQNNNNNNNRKDNYNQIIVLNDNKQQQLKQQQQQHEQQQQIQWGQGLSQIKHLQNLYIYQKHINQPQIYNQQQYDNNQYILQNIYQHYLKPYHQKYILPVSYQIKQKISTNQHSQRLFIYVNQHKRKFKYFMFILLIIIIVVMINNVFVNESKVLDRGDDVFKKKKYSYNNNNNNNSNYSKSQRQNKDKDKDKNKNRRKR